MDKLSAPDRGLRKKIYEVIFESDTPAGKWFDILLIFSIILSVIVVMLDSVNDINAHYGKLLYWLEWFFTGLFTLEYILRLYSIGNTTRYAFSFFGLVDLFAILPTYISLFLPGSQYLIAIRILRILRIFRVLKLIQFMSESQLLMQALWASRRKIIVFLFSVFSLVIIFGSFMYLIEGEENGFTSIPRGVYWAVVTLTTVGYGDISPHTSLGQALATIIMVMGYSIIAVPTGIVTSEMTHLYRERLTHIVCPECSSEDHLPDSKYCKDCGARI